MNNNRDALDDKIREALNESAGSIAPSDFIKGRIDARIDLLQDERNKGIYMINTKFIKAAAIVTACVALSGTAAYAVGTSQGWHGSSTAYEYTDYADISKAADKAGLNVDLPEAFSNGYSFEYTNVDEFGQLDDNGGRINKFKGVDVNYTKDGEPYINVSVEPVVGNDDDPSDPPISEREIADGITAYYDSHEMLIVPPGYEVSEEDRKREQEDPKFWISEGSDEVEHNICTDVRFIMNGQKYLIMGFNLNLTPDEMFDMASEIANR